MTASSAPGSLLGILDLSVAKSDSSAWLRSHSVGTQGMGSSSVCFAIFLCLQAWLRKVHTYLVNLPFSFC